MKVPNTARFRMRCGCGGEIFFLPNDWTCHYKHRGLLRTIRHILLTRFEFGKLK